MNQIKHILKFIWIRMLFYIRVEMLSLSNCSQLQEHLPLYLDTVRFSNVSMHWAQGIHAHSPYAIYTSSDSRKRGQKSFTPSISFNKLNNCFHLLIFRITVAKGNWSIQNLFCSSWEHILSKSSIPTSARASALTNSSRRKRGSFSALHATFGKPSKHGHG